MIHNQKEKNIILKNMITDNLQNQIKAILEGKLGEQDFGLESNLKELGADSLDVVEIIEAIEEKLEIHISDQEVDKFAQNPTFGKLCQMVEDKLNWFLEIMQELRQLFSI